MAIPQWQHSFQALGSRYTSRANPDPASSPEWMGWNEALAEQLQWPQDLRKTDEALAVFAGQSPLEGTNPSASVYAGHQFGQYNPQLGDGRAILLGEWALSPLEHYDIQLKGAGQTPYSRGGDGKSPVGPVVREYLVSEAMHHLGVPTTRALAAIATGDKVFRNTVEPGAVMVRVAKSHLRFGSIQYFAMTRDGDGLAELVDYAAERHFAEIISAKSAESTAAKAEVLLEETVKRIASLVAQWQSLGFVHGVMNTDNMSIHGLTIDYGPYGWLEDYNPGWTPNTTDASNRRYRYAQQPQIGAWNLARWLESLIPLMEQPERLEAVLDHYGEVFNDHHNQMWVAKLGLDSWQESDQLLVAQLNSALQTIEIDMTIFFRLLSTLQRPTLDQLSPSFYEPLGEAEQPLGEWLEAWITRTKGAPDQAAMKAANPKYVLRNWMAQLAIDDAEKGDYSTCEALERLLKAPYDEQPEMEAAWFQRRPEWARNRVGCSMLSCSS